MSRLTGNPKNPHWCLRHVLVLVRAHLINTAILTWLKGNKRHTLNPPAASKILEGWRSESPAVKITQGGGKLDYTGKRGIWRAKRKGLRREMGQRPLGSSRKVKGVSEGMEICLSLQHLCLVQSWHFNATEGLSLCHLTPPTSTSHS